MRKHVAIVAGTGACILLIVGVTLLWPTSEQGVPSHAGAAANSEPIDGNRQRRDFPSSPASNAAEASTGNTQAPPHSKDTENSNDVADGEAEPKPFRHKWTSYLLFDYSELPENAKGVLQVFDYQDGMLGQWEEYRLETRVAKTGRLAEGTYFVMLTGETVWRSDDVTLAKHEERTVVLRQGGRQGISATVLDNETGDPIERAALLIASHTSPGSEVDAVPGVLALSAPDGGVVLEDQPAAELPYRVEKFGYLPVDLNSGIVARGVSHLGTVRLKRATGQITVHYDLSGVEHVRWVMIELMASAGRFKSAFPASGEFTKKSSGELVSTQSAGEITFTSLVPGRLYFLSVYVALERKKTPDEQRADPLDSDLYIFLKSGHYVSDKLYAGDVVRVEEADLDWNE